jgi:hypothetical protein
MGYRAESESELLVRIRVILAEIPRDILNPVVFEWMDRLQNVSRPMDTASGGLKKHQSGKPFFFGRFLVATLDVGHLKSEDIRSDKLATIDLVYPCR